jgi:3'(2'), 5'-bisphosphate nucleotidase
VTAADHEAEAILLLALERLEPAISVIAEELAAAGRLPPPQGKFFLVDALDGTRHFIKGKPEFSINVALIDNTAPVFGLIYVPPSGRLFVTRSDGRSYGGVIAPGAAADTPLDQIGLKPLASRVPDRANLVAFNSRTAGGASSDFLKLLDVREARPYGSSEKFCLIAEGQGDLYARFGPTYEWDTAAGQAILEAAGGSVTSLDGTRLTYGKVPDAYLNPSFVAWGRKPLVTGFGEANRATGSKSALGS